VQDSTGLPPVQEAKRMPQMHLSSPTSPAHVAVSSDIMKKSSSATCQSRRQWQVVHRNAG
jgi:hypothetical protein